MLFAVCSNPSGRGVQLVVERDGYTVRVCKCEFVYEVA